MQFLIPSRHNAWLWSQFLLMLFGIFILRWRTDTILVAFSLEGFVIGIIQFFKMQSILWFGNKERETFFNSPTQKLGSFFVIFITFLVYCLFCSAHLLFIFVFILKENPQITNPLDFISNLSYFFNSYAFLQTFVATTLGVLYYTMSNFYLHRKYHLFTVNQLFAPTFSRVFLQQFLVILSGYLYLSLGETRSLAVLLLLVCFLVDNAFLFAKISPTFSDKIFNLLTKLQGEKFKDESEKETYKQALFES